MGAREPDGNLGQNAGWGSSEDLRARAQHDRVERRGIFRFVAEDTWRDKLGFLLIAAWLIVVTIWVWLNEHFGVPPWVGWASMGAVAVVFVTISLLPRRHRS